MKIEKAKLVNKLKDLEEEFDGEWDWLYALRGYAIFTALIVTIASIVDHFITAIAIMLIMNMWVVLGTFSISNSLRKDLSKEERIKANLKNTTLFSAGLFIPLAAMISGTGMVFAGVFIILAIVSFFPSIFKYANTVLAKLKGQKERVLNNYMLDRHTSSHPGQLLYLKASKDSAHNDLDDKNNIIL